MADKDEDLDLDVKGGGKSNTLLLIILIVLLLVVGGGGAAFFLMGDKDKGEEAAAEGEHAAEAVEEKETHYLELGKEFVVNLEDNRKVNYLQVEIQVMARSGEPLRIIEENMPLVRNKVMLILSSQKYEELNTREGKEKLREAIKQAIQEILHEESANANIEAVYFTSLIMQ